MFNNWDQSMESGIVAIALSFFASDDPYQSTN